MIETSNVKKIARVYLHNDFFLKEFLLQKKEKKKMHDREFVSGGWNDRSIRLDRSNLLEQTLSHVYFFFKTTFAFILPAKQLYLNM